MDKLTILGTGSAMVTKCYNACFTLSNGSEHFLVDTGGGNTILTNLEKSQISINSIHNLFISHCHNDHITGVVWIIRAVAQQIISGNYSGNLTIYCHEENIKIISTISNLILEKNFNRYIGERIFFKNVFDGCKHQVLDYTLQFFDIRSTKLLQFGFTTKLSNDKKLTFLGDESYKKELYKYAVSSDYLLHEAFCLYSEKEKFKPYEKHHGTVKDACENAKDLNVKTVVLYHTEDKNILKRNELYTEEGRKVFKGNIMVPNDLEVIELL